MIKEYNVIFKFEGKQIVRKYYVRNTEQLYKSINHDKELLSDDKVVSIIYDKKKNYVAEF